MIMLTIDNVIIRKNKEDDEDDSLNDDSLLLRNLCYITNTLPHTGFFLHFILTRKTPVLSLSLSSSPLSSSSSSSSSSL